VRDKRKKKLADAAMVCHAPHLCPSPQPMHTSEPHFLQLLLSLKPHKLISLGLTIAFLEGRKGGKKK
jgi:hypothetical protein